MNIVLIALISRKKLVQTYKENSKITVKVKRDWMYVIYKGKIEVMIEGNQGNLFSLRLKMCLVKLHFKIKDFWNATIEVLFKDFRNWN